MSSISSSYNKTGPDGTVVDFNDYLFEPFGRLRVSELHPIFESVLKYDLQPLIWDGSTTGSSATVTHDPNTSSAILAVGTASGEKVVRCSRIYCPYTPGRAQLVMMTGTLGAKKTNVRTRIGYFDDQNGLFFENDGVDIKVVRRSYVTGTAVDTAVTQSNWNLDKADGTGPSQFTFNPAMANIFIIDFEWLGSGRVRFGFKNATDILYVHELVNSNTLALPYMTTGKLPVAYTIENTGTSASTTSMRQTCCTVMHEGAPVGLGVPRSLDRGITTIGSTSNIRRPILSMRIGASYIRTTVAIDSFELVSTDVSPPTALYEVILNGTLAGASFNTAIGYVEKDMIGVTLTGGTVIHSGYIASGAKTGGQLTSDSIPESVFSMGADSAGNSDILSLCVTSIGANATWLGQINYREIT